MIVQTPWEKLLAPESEFKLVPVKDTELAHFYWCTEIKTTEIWQAFSVETSGVAANDIVGPARFDGMACKRCGNGMFAVSRTDALHRVKELGRYDEWPWAKFADPRICRDCKKDVYRQEHGAGEAAYRAERDAREARQRELRFMPYREYLQTPEWLQAREAALKRARFMCQVCSERSRLQVHHRTYVRRGCEHAADLIVLCEPCHQTFHERMELAEGGRAA
jgi:5-methylcytosine-specific restriction endonuclease McrA